MSNFNNNNYNNYNNNNNNGNHQWVWNAQIGQWVLVPVIPPPPPPPVIYPPEINCGGKSDSGLSFFASSLIWFLGVVGFLIFGYIAFFIMQGTSIDSPVRSIIATVAGHMAMLLAPVIVILIVKRRGKGRSKQTSTSDFQQPSGQQGAMQTTVQQSPQHQSPGQTSGQTSAFRSFLKITRLDRGLSLYQVMLIVVLGGAGIFAFTFFAQIFILFLELLGYNRPEGGVIPIPSGMGLGGLFLMLFALVAIMPSITEEVFIRGGVQRGMETRGKMFAILMTGLMFSLMHKNPMQTVHQFFLGVIFAYIVIETRSLWAGMLLHFVNNFIAICFTVFYMWAEEQEWFQNINGYANGYYESATSNGYETIGLLLASFMFSAIALPIVIAMLYLLSRHSHKLEGKYVSEFKVFSRLKDMCKSGLSKGVVDSTSSLNSDEHFGIHLASGQVPQQSRADRVKNIWAWFFIGLGFAVCLVFWFMRFFA
ncbi:MAG: CPBP family intramembrane metalloprotease [Firmicutes bacterium]|nr:CPBP family intramembrane metalloprotease [Bacillota bacterium]